MTAYYLVLTDLVFFFLQLWRVNKVLQFRRARIKVSQVAGPALCLLVAATALLAVWTAISDFRWEREEIDELSGESIGRCTGSHTVALLVPVAIICVIPTVLTGIMAWKTSDVDDLYTESKWIFSLILVQLQVRLQIAARRSYPSQGTESLYIMYRLSL